MNQDIQLTILDSKNVTDLQAHCLKELHDFITTKIGRELEDGDLPEKSAAQLETSLISYTSKKFGNNFLTPNYNEAENLSYLKQRIVDYLNTAFRNIIAKDYSLDKDDKSENVEIGQIFTGLFGNEENKKEVFKNFAIALSGKISDVINKEILKRS